MKILVAGGSGMIGSVLSRHFLSKGHQLTMLTRSERKEMQIGPNGGSLEWAHWDGETITGWGHLAGECEAVINLAGENIGEKRWSEDRKRSLRTSRVLPGVVLLSAIQQSAHRPDVFLQIAGTNYYAPRGDEPLDEQADRGSDFLASVAQAWENTAAPVQELGVRHVIMRTGAVLTRKGGLIDPFLLQNRLFAGGPLGSGKQWLSWIHIQDLIIAFEFLLERQNAHGVFNVTSPQPVTNAEFGKTLSKLLHRPYWFPVPAFMLRLVLGEMSTLVLDGVRAVPARLLEMGFSFRFGSLPAALEDLLKK
jgi:uncharacterized protein (TIGR01777 family)